MKAGCAYVAEEHVLFHVAVDEGLRQAVEALARRDDRRRARRGGALQEATRWTSCCGSRRSRASRRGRRRPASRRRAVRAGTSNARRWPGSISARPSTSTAAASIWCFRTTRTRSRNRAAPSIRTVMANYWMHNGFLQVEGEKMAKSARQFRHDPRSAGRLAGRGGCAFQHAAHALSSADRLDGEGPARKPRRRLIGWSCD